MDTSGPHLASHVRRDMMQMYANAPCWKRERLLLAILVEGKNYCSHWVLRHWSQFLKTAIDRFSLIKPDIVFFGEVMPNRFSQLVHDDVASTDLVIVMGTSLLVAPVANVPDWAPSSCTRLLINREIVGSFRLKKSNDVIFEGDCDEGVRKLCQLAGWEDELDQMFRDCHKSVTYPN